MSRPIGRLVLKGHLFSREKPTKGQTSRSLNPTGLSEQPRLPLEARSHRSPL